MAAEEGQTEAPASGKKEDAEARPNTSGSTVEVVVRHGTDLDEYIVYVAPDCSLRDVKLALATELRRPEVMAEANFITALPNGMTVPISDAQKLGSRRLLLIEGVQLSVQEQARAPRSLVDFDEYDPAEEILSPRSLRACTLEGISAEDLIYCPQDAYAAVSGISPRRAELRHGFFEALRQDQLIAARYVRELLIWAESNQLPVDAMSLDRFTGADIDALRGLPQSEYPEVLHFFQAQWRTVADSQHLGCKAADSPDPIHLWGPRSSPKAPELPKQPLPLDKSLWKGERSGADRRAGGKAADRSIYDRLADQNDELREQLKGLKVDASSQLDHLRSLPGGVRHAHSQLLDTESRALVQQFRDSQAFYHRQDELLRLVKLRNEATDAQLSWFDRELGYAEWLRGGVQKRALRNAAADNDMQRERYGELMKKSFQWHTRRCNTHREQLAWQRYRQEELDSSTHLYLERAAHVHEVKNINTVRHARQWARRRIRLEQGRVQVAQGWVKWRADVSSKLAKKDEYTRDQKYLQLKIHEYKLELKALREAFRELAAEREKRRLEHRVALKPPRIAAQKRSLDAVKGANSAPTKSSQISAPDSQISIGFGSRSSPMLSAMSSNAQRSSHTSTSLSREPRFDFPRVASASIASASTASTFARAPGWHKRLQPAVGLDPS